MSATRARGTARKRRAPGAARTSSAPGPVRWTPARLMAEAERARVASYSPYSRFAVGAALLTRGGRVIHGCNVENASFGLSICAERTAVFKAVSEGEQDFVACAVTAGTSGGAAPCGGCRQVLHEFAPGLTLYWRDGRGRIVRMPLTKALARPFDLVRNRTRTKT